MGTSGLLVSLGINSVMVTVVNDSAVESIENNEVKEAVVEYLDEEPLSYRKLRQTKKIETMTSDYGLFFPPVNDSDTEFPGLDDITEAI